MLFRVLSALMALASLSAAAADGRLLAGASIVDISPRELPVIVNGGFLEATADKVNDPLHARCLVVREGATTVAIVVVDTCVIPADFADAVKAKIEAATGIPSDRIVISATHTHSAPSLMECLGSGADERYVRFLPDRVVAGVAAALASVRPARAGWTVVRAPHFTNCRRWILRPDKIRKDPFGEPTVRAMMHPGYQNPDFIGPAGPIDPDLSLLSIQALDGGRPLALFANYSMHYFGAAALSADYYGLFASAAARRIAAEPAGDPAFVAIMSQGTAGDLHWMDYSRPQQNVAIAAYAEGLAETAARAYGSIQHQENVTIAMAETKLTLRRRVPDERRLEWARRLLATMRTETGERKPRSIEEVYAREQVLLAADPVRTLTVQALRIGGLGIVAIPCEVFGITGLKIKARSPLERTIVMELANGEEGYIPPPAQHALGGYTTWPARTAALEVGAEPAIVEAALKLLEEVAGKPRRAIRTRHGPAAETILAARPLAYWRLEESEGPAAADATGNGAAAEYAPSGIAYYLDGVPGPAAGAPGPRFAREGETNRAVHLAGGGLNARVAGLGPAYTAIFWFWNGLPADARAVTGWLFERGEAADAGAPDDRLGIGGTGGAPGRLFFASAGGAPVAGSTAIEPRTWHRATFVRDGRRFAAFLDGKLEISGEAPEPAGAIGKGEHIFVGGRAGAASSADGAATFEGKIDEVAIFGRALQADEIEHLGAAEVGDSATVPIGSRLEPFVDDFLIERASNVALRLHPPIEREIVFRFDAPWEGPQSAYATIMQDGDRIRLYYRGGGDLSREHACIAESDDGIRFARPSLGLFEFKGSRDNNIIWTGKEKGYWEAHNFTPFKDTNPAAPPSERYKALTLSRAIPPGESDRRKVLMAFVSPDGIRWSRLREEPIITDGSFDSQNVAFWDPQLGRYVCYLRQGRDGKRSVMRATSIDFVAWTKPEWLDFGDTRLEQFYTNAIAPYSRAPHVLLGFPMRFVPERKVYGFDARPIAGVSDAVFMASRDGLRWRRTFMEAFIRPGLDGRNWWGNPHGNNTPAWGLARTGPAEISVYWMQNYAGGAAGEEAPWLRRGTVRLDGFVSVNAPYAGGEFTTRPIVFSGSRLAINYSTSAVGSIRVELIGADGEPIAGYAAERCREIFGDEIERVVAWEGGADLGPLAARPVRLRFVMKDADLYAFRCADATAPPSSR